MFITHDFTIKKDNCESLNNLSSNVLNCTAVKVAISQEQQKRNQVKSCSLLGPHV